MKIILASGSPRRKELMEKIGLKFEIDPAEIDERKFKEKSAEKLVEILAVKKAEAVATRHPNSIIIGSDLTVALDDHQIGKPENATDAKKILKLLRDKTHQVLTGVAIINTANNKTASAVETANVKMRDYSDKEIDNYIATGEPLDKAGAYAIQGHAAAFIEKIEGSYSGVMGLPLYETAELLALFGMEVL